ncbi:MAG: SDR family oxidoreductase [Planctomycetes bacterium]|nr:SDR family oxidoreductase [Planctomycetota bacterium]
MLLAARDAARLEEARVRLAALGKGPVAATPADVSRPDEASRLCQEAVQRFGALHGLVANAGGPRSAPFMETTEADWAEAISLNLLSAVRLAHAALPTLAKGRYGRMVFLTSMAALQPAKNLILSTTVRAGVHGFAKALSDEVAPLGITVNCLCPGYTRTERLAHLSEDLARREETTAAAVEARWTTQIPVGRLGRVEEVANAAAFLLGETSAYVTGQKLVVDGGLVRAV